MANDNTRGRSRLGMPPYLRTQLNLVERIDSNTGLDINGNLILGADNRYIAFGAAGVTDSSIYWDGSNLTLKDSTTGTKTLAQLAAGTTTLDQAFDNGKLIDSSANTGASNAFSVGGAATDDKVEIYHTGTEAHINARADDLYITAAGGDINLNDDNLTTTGSVTCHGIVNTTTAIDTTAALQVGADNVKLSLGTDDATDSYLQFSGTNLEIYSAAAINFYASTDTSDYISFTTTADVPSIVTAGTCNLTIAPDGGTLNVTGVLSVSSTLSAATNSTIGNLTLGNGSITDSGGAISFGNENLTTQGTINIASDNINLTIGASGATDAYLKFDGAGNLVLYDTNTGAVNLVDLAGGSLTNPDVTGDLTITNGQFIWTDSTDEVAGTWTFSGTTNDCIDIVANSVTSANILDISSTSLDSGTGVLVQLDESVVSGGFYFRGYDTNGTATVWSVAEDGVTTIAGKSGDALVITLGNAQITNGDIDMDEGKIEVNTTSDETSYIKKNAAGTAAVVEIENTEVTSTGSGLLIDQNATGNAIALEITHDGDLAAIDIVASAARTGNVINIPMANQVAQTALDITGAATGTASEGIVHVDVTGALAGNAIRVDSTGANAATGQLCYLLSTGNQAAATNGICAYFEDQGTVQATSYNTYILSTANNGLYIGTKAAAATSLTVTAGVTAGETASMVLINGTAGNGFVGASGVGMLHLSNDKALAHTGSSMLYVTYTGDTDTGNIVSEGSCAYFYENGTIEAGSYAVGINAAAGNALKLTTATITTTNLNCIGGNGQTANMVYIDGTNGANGWIGSATTAMVHLKQDGGTLANNAASMMLIDFDGTAAAAATGTCLQIQDAAAGGGGYAVYINAAGNTEALHIDAGTVLIDETLKATGGVMTVYSENDVTDPPSQAEMDTAFGAGAEALNGMIGVINDANGGANVWLCVCADGAWYYAAKLTIGA